MVAGLSPGSSMSALVLWMEEVEGLEVRPDTTPELSLVIVFRSTISSPGTPTTSSVSASVSLL